VRLVAMTRQKQMQLQTQFSVPQVLIRVYLLFLVVRHPIPGEYVRLIPVNMMTVNLYQI